MLVTMMVRYELQLMDDRRATYGTRAVSLEAAQALYAGTPSHSYTA